MIKTYLRNFSAIVLFVLIVFAAGCGGGNKGPKTYGVEGTVTHKGTPLAGASVTFYPAGSDGIGAGAQTDASGKYRLQTAAGAAGTVPGTYTVTVSKRESVPTGKKIQSTDDDGKPVTSDEMTLKETLPEQYTTIQNTPFKSVNVEAKKLNTFDFALE